MSTPLTTIYLWLGQPDDETPEHLLMMLTDGASPDDEQVYRPLMAVNRVDADQLEQIAQQAATALGVSAVLREYEVTRSTGGLPWLHAIVRP